MLARERTWYGDAEIRAGLMRIWQVMQNCVRRGFEAQGLLPGVLGVRRRAPKLYRQLMSGDPSSPMHALDWVNVFALAVNEENAAGGQVVTAPTNGAAGIVPAVLHYYRRFEPGADDEGVMRFLLTAAAIGMLYKQNASISGAEMGCQGEVGVACSMAAAGLVSALNGSNEQIENAAEIGMEHNLGLTCDPVAGLVQIPCIERNAMGSVKAINAARLALRGDGSHKVSLDQVIATMRQTGPRHVDDLQGDLAGRARRQRTRMLSGPRGHARRSYPVACKPWAMPLMVARTAPNNSWSRRSVARQRLSRSTCMRCIGSM